MYSKIPVKKPIIILLSGYMRSGKDVVGKYLVDSYGFQRYAFADMLKDEAASMYNIDRSSLDSQEGKMKMLHNGKSAREILIEHGQQRRSENIDYWVERVADRIANDRCENVVITDWRFPNEYIRFLEHEKFKKHVVSTWRIQRWETPPLLDASEIALDNFPFSVIVDNKNEVTSLLKNVDNIIGKIIKPKFLITDIDDVLFKWLDGFRKHCHEIGLMTFSEYPSAWLMYGWLLDKYGNKITQEEIQRLVLDFNTSEKFGNLEPYSEAKECLERAKSLGYEIVAISSCTDDIGAISRRCESLQKNFPGCIDDVICLPLNKRKTDVLKKFPPSIFIDDNLSNVKDGINAGHRTFLMKRPWSAFTPEMLVIPMVSNWNEMINII